MRLGGIRSTGLFQKKSRKSNSLQTAGLASTHAADALVLLPIALARS
jgi:hypothetical protein